MNRLVRLGPYTVTPSPAWTPPSVDFSADTVETGIGLEIVFSPVPDTLSFYRWDFGDGTTSTEVYPVKSYESVGDYTITLTVNDTANGSDVETKVDYISVIDAPEANFSASPLSGEAGITEITFTDQSTGAVTSWSWDFGDGSEGSIDQNPTHTYDFVGTYTVTLTVIGPGGSSEPFIREDYIVMDPPPAPVAAFTRSPDTVTPNPPDNISTYDASTSTGVISTYLWEIKENGAPEELYQVFPGEQEEVMEITYSDLESMFGLFSGTYDVRLTVSGPGGNDEDEQLANLIQAE